MTGTDREICRALFVLHEIKIGPSRLLVKKKNLMLRDVAALETRALKYLAGYAIGEIPRQLLQDLHNAVQIVGGLIPVSQGKSPGNPLLRADKKQTSSSDEAIIARHLATNVKVGTLVRKAGGTNEDRRRISREIGRRKKRSAILD